MKEMKLYLVMGHLMGRQNFNIKIKELKYKLSPDHCTVPSISIFSQLSTTVFLFIILYHSFIFCRFVSVADVHVKA